MNPIIAVEGMRLAIKCDRLSGELAQQRKEAERLRNALEKYRGQIDNEGKHSAANILSDIDQHSHD